MRTRLEGYYRARWDSFRYDMLPEFLRRTKDCRYVIYQFIDGDLAALDLLSKYPDF